jgi:hypothetical protein
MAVSGNATFASGLATNTFASSGAATLSNTLAVTGVATFSNSTPATNSTNAAVVVAGGIGVGADSYFGTGKVAVNQINIRTGDGGIALGFQAGAQGVGAVAIGYQAGQSNQNINAVAIGYQAGQYNNGTYGANAVAVGWQAGQATQQNGVAIGEKAGQTGQGVNAVAIGNFAGLSNQHDRSIIINAQGVGTGLNSTFVDSCYIAPIRGVSNASYNGSTICGLYYNTNSKEILHNTYTTSAKSFVIDHPLDNTKHLVHVCLEGPESGVYYRGKSEIINNDSVSISLPEYVQNLAYDFTIQITPIYQKEPVYLSTSRVKNNQFTVYGKNTEFFWQVHGKRFDIEVEPNKSSVIVKGDGPYRWI